MSVFDRISAIFRPRPPVVRTPARVSVRKDDAGAAGDGQLTMGAAQLKQMAALSRMRRGVADVSVSRQRLDLQSEDLKQAMASLARQAAASTAAGNSGAAQSARGRLAIMAEQHGDLLEQRNALAEQEAMLTGELAQLQARVSGFNATAQTLEAARTAARARQDIAASLGELQDPGPDKPSPDKPSPDEPSPDK